VERRAWALLSHQFPHPLILPLGEVRGSLEYITKREGYLVIVSQGSDEPLAPFEVAPGPSQGFRIRLRQVERRCLR
jgi:hypothetical protein